MKNVLLIESNDDSLVLLKEILEEHGWNVLGTTLRENAHQILDRGISLDLIMLSTVIENVESTDILRIIRDSEALHQVPVIAITQSAETNEGALAQNRGFCAFVTKPIEEDGVMQVIDSVCDRKGQG